MSEDRAAALKRIEEIKNRVQKATPGPWLYWEHHTPGTEYDGMSGVKDAFGTNFVDAPKSNAKADHKFIAHARDDIPWLVALIESLLEEGGR